MSKIETSEIHLPKKNITSGSILEKCSFILNMREWASCHETMDPTDKSKYSAKWLWDVIMHMNGKPKQEMKENLIFDQSIGHNQQSLGDTW
jgi:hypothetical protein